MKDHLSQNQIEDYCQRKLPAIELLSVSDHLEVCDLCRRRIETASNGDSAFVSLRTEVLGETADTTHVTVEQTVAYVDGALAPDELQIVDDHLHYCAECAHAVDDLRAFKDQIGDHINTRYSPASASRRNETRTRRLFFLPSFAVAYPTFAIAATITVLVVAITGWLIWRASQKTAAEKDIAVSPSPAEQAPTVDQVPVIAQLNDADGHVTLNQAGQLSGVDRLPLEYQKLVKDALANQRIESSPSLSGLVRPPSSLMSSDKDNVNFSVIEPVAKVLLTDRPTFRWSALAGASSYVAEIYDDQLNLVIASPQLTGHSWTPAKSLARARIYSWQVKAAANDKTVVAPRPPAPQAKFRIVDSATAEEITEARRSYASAHLLLGMLYARAGLLDDARQEFSALEAANPESKIVRKLLASLPSVRR